MANSWFQFKRFRVGQEQAAMKVSTDACIFGAWLSTLFKDKTFDVLDIGTGTGLLALMYLQENPESRVYALEPNAAALRDATSNFVCSAWKDNVILEQVAFQEFSKKSKQLFDLLICNPPFFQDHLKAGQADRNMARHDALLPEELADGAARLANYESLLAVMYPGTVWPAWLKAALNAGWHLRHQLDIQPAAHKAVNRVCGVFGRQRADREPLAGRLQIRDNGNNYTEQFQSLLQPYYLNL